MYQCVIKPMAADVSTMYARPRLGMNFGTLFGLRA
jgi:hypothetical protein